MIISPIYEERRSELGARVLQAGENLSYIACFFLILFPFFFASFLSDDYEGMGYGFFMILSWLIAPFVGFGNLFGKISRSSGIRNYDNQYEKIYNKYKKISKKKVNAKDVDKIAKQLETENFSYSEVLDIFVYHEGLDEHSESLKKKKIKTVVDDKITTKKGEKIYFKTHTIWSQGSPDDHVLKDVGYIYITNKRIIFLGDIKSYSVNFTRITNFDHGDNFIQVQKTAGANDIYQVYSPDSNLYAHFLFDKFNR